PGLPRGSGRAGRGRGRGGKGGKRGRGGGKKGGRRQRRAQPTPPRKPWNPPPRKPPWKPPPWKPPPWKPPPWKPPMRASAVVDAATAPRKTTLANAIAVRRDIASSICLHL